MVPGGESSGRERAWPSQVAYQDAIQNPSTAFADPDLRSARPLDLTPFGLPQPVTGQYATVYRMEAADGRLWAVRLFRRDVQGRTEVYRAFRAHRDALTSAGAFIHGDVADGDVAGLVPFEYQERGIFAQGQWYPLVRMPWVTGVPLNAFVEASLNDPKAIDAVGKRFRYLASALAQARVAHGDLQHGNLLVEPESGALRLIDYDGVYVPALAGRPGRETGHPSYQHPERTTAHYGPLMDRFSLLVIAAALTIVAREPEHWYRLDNGDNLLFRSEDFANPSLSRAFEVLRVSRDAQVQRAVRALREASAAPIGRVPALERAFP